MKKFIILFFFIWRIGLLAVAFLSTFFLPTFGDRFPYWQEMLVSSGWPHWLWSWGNFDGVHYLTIAKSGYSAQFTQAFFPLYPLLTRGISRLFGLSFLSAALFLSNLFTIIFLLLLAHLLLIEGFRQDRIKWIIFFYLIFPFSFFLVSVYNESLFLALVLASFILAKKKRWFLTGLFGAMAAATRLVGVFLLPALIIEWWKVKSKVKSQKSKVFWILLVPLGLLSYMWYLAKAFADPLYFIHAQPAFGASRTGGEVVLLPQVVWRYLTIFVTVPINHYDFWVAGWEMGAVMVFLIFTLLYWRKIRISYLIFSLLAVLTPALSGTFSSMPRYLLVSFPLFIMHTFIKRTWLKLTLASMYAILLFIFTTLFLRGYWVS